MQKPKSSKILSLLLAVIMVVGMLPFTALPVSAVEYISKIEFNDVKLPVVGEKVSWDRSTPSDAKYKTQNLWYYALGGFFGTPSDKTTLVPASMWLETDVPVTDLYDYRETVTFEYFHWETWQSSTEAIPQKLSFEGTFKSGKYYTVLYNVKKSDNTYNWDRLENLTATINGAQANVSDVHMDASLIDHSYPEQDFDKLHGAQDEGGVYTVWKCYGPLDFVTEAYASVTPPQLGKNPNFFAEKPPADFIPYGNNYRVWHYTEWYESDEQPQKALDVLDMCNKGKATKLEKDSVFTSGKYYTAVVQLIADQNNGYCFNPNYTKFYINRQQADITRQQADVKFDKQGGQQVAVAGYTYPKISPAQFQCRWEDGAVYCTDLTDGLCEYEYLFTLCKGSKPVTDYRTTKPQYSWLSTMESEGEGDYFCCVTAFKKESGGAWADYCHGDTSTISFSGISDISILTPPLTTWYIEGEDFDPDGMTLLFEYENGWSVIKESKNERPVSGTEIIGGENLTASTKSVTIRCTVGSTTKEIECPVTVYPLYREVYLTVNEGDDDIGNATVPLTGAFVPENDDIFILRENWRMLDKTVSYTSWRDSWYFDNDDGTFTVKGKNTYKAEIVLWTHDGFFADDAAVYVNGKSVNQYRDEDGRLCFTWEYTSTCNHQWGEWKLRNSDVHYSTCSVCLEEKTADHSFGTTPIADDGDTLTFKCADCGYEIKKSSGKTQVRFGLRIMDSPVIVGEKIPWTFEVDGYSNSADVGGECVESLDVKWYTVKDSYGRLEEITSSNAVFKSGVDYRVDVTITIKPDYCFPSVYFEEGNEFLTQNYLAMYFDEGDPIKLGMSNETRTVSFRFKINPADRLSGGAKVAIPAIMPGENIINAFDAVKDQIRWDGKPITGNDVTVTFMLSTADSGIVGSYAYANGSWTKSSITDESIFKANTLYTLSIYIIPTDQTKSISVSDVEVVGQSNADRVEISHFIYGYNLVVGAQYFNGESYVDEISITDITTPAEGGTPDTSAAVPQNAGYEIAPGGITWEGNPTAFEGGKTYTVNVTLNAKGENIFISTVSMTVNGESNVKVKEITNNGKTITLSYTFPKSNINLEITARDSFSVYKDANISITPLASHSDVIWLWTDGDLPDGLTFYKNTGTLSGVPTESGEFTFEVTVVHSSGAQAKKVITLEVCGIPEIQTSTLPNATVGVEYSAYLYAQGYPDDFIFDLSLQSDDMPSGLKLRGDGLIYGTPTSAGTYSFTVSAENVYDEGPAKTVTITVTEAPVKFFSITLPTGTGYTVREATGSEELSVAQNGEYNFVVNIAEDYEKGSDFAVKANGVILTADANGVYIIKAINENQTVTVEGVQKKASILYGDIDGNGILQAADARLCLRASVGLEVYAANSVQALACDVDGNGTIQAADARLILRKSVGLETSFPAEKK